MHGIKLIVKVCLFILKFLRDEKETNFTCFIFPFFQAPGRPIEIMRESSPQSNRAITPGYVRVILSDETGQVLYTPILQPE